MNVNVYGGVVTGSRRRGAELERALAAAALAELAERGYGGLTMEGVAARAGTGKAAVYRRWSGKQDLVLDALRGAIPPVPPPGDRHGLRDDLRAALTALCDVLAGRTDLPAMNVMVDLLRHPDLRAGFDAQVVRPRLAVIEERLRDAERTGEIARPAGPLAALAGPAMIVHWLVVEGRTPDEDDIERILDTMLAGT